jgi:predicted ATPase
MDSPFLDSLAIARYGAVGPEIQFLYSFKKINIFIGQNNAGKSTFLKAIHRHFANYTGSGSKSRESALDTLEAWDNSVPEKVVLGLGLPEKIYQARLYDAVDASYRNPHVQNLTRLVTEALSHEGYVWERLPIFNQGRRFLPWIDQAEAQQRISLKINSQGWYDLFRLFTPFTSGGDTEMHKRETFHHLFRPFIYSIPKVALIPAKRIITKEDIDTEDFGGAGLIHQLANLQNPDHNERHLRRSFDQINEFVRYVTGKIDAAIEIPYRRDHVLVHIDGRVLPLSSLGTGIHEVVLLASFCTICKNMIICLEEPEIHLHPALQRKLIDYLYSETSNQYFIATHSASFIDAERNQVYVVRHDGKGAAASRLSNRREWSEACHSLGYRPSDIVQANAVIWVEGPSDRIYLRHWLKNIAPELQEELHFSIMFYGGRLLSHLTTDDQLKDFISLRYLNRFTAIVMDSDKPSPYARINSTKKRIKEESSKGAFVWITAGREIENYIQPDKIASALQFIYGDEYVSACKTGIFDHLLPFNRKITKRNKQITREDVDKVAVANYICAQTADLSVLDLKDRISELADFIRAANQLADTNANAGSARAP